MRLLFALLPILLILSGCSFPPPAISSSSPGLSIQGILHGGKQPVVDAHVYLLAANTTGYGQPSASLLNASSTGASDAIGAYVTTSSTGAFSITGDYACTPNTQVYVYALGGNPGAGVNSAAGFLALLGNCPNSGNFLTAVPYIWVDEVSTIAAAYAFTGFATDPTHVSSSGTALAQTGIQNAFANAANLVDLSNGVALDTTPAGNGSVPQREINTLANILASCVNSTGPSSPACSTLFSNSLSKGSSGAIPTNTADAAINIAHNPGTNIATLFALTTPASPFQPVLPSAPGNFTIRVEFAEPAGPIHGPNAVAIDRPMPWAAPLTSTTR